jgi:hypothetical protein
VKPSLHLAPQTSPLRLPDFITSQHSVTLIFLFFFLTSLTLKFLCLLQYLPTHALPQISPFRLPERNIAEQVLLAQTLLGGQLIPFIFFGKISS